jgi:ribosomal protein S18 acetylase RimI-like enzyme
MTDRPAGVTVRQAVVADWPTMRAVRLAALADAPTAFITTLAEAESYPDQLWRDRIAAHPHFLLELDGEPAGMSVALHGPHFAEVVGVWVHPAARGRGAVEALIDAVAGWAQGQGLAELRLWVVVGNARAEGAYGRAGFVRTGNAQPVPGRRQETEVEMALVLPPDRGAAG